MGSKGASSDERRRKPTLARERRQDGRVDMIFFAQRRRRAACRPNGQPEDSSRAKAREGANIAKPWSMVNLLSNNDLTDFDAKVPRVTIWHTVRSGQPLGSR